MKTTDDWTLLRRAKYSPDFLRFVGGQKFHNPATGKDVVFESLPPAEKRKIHAQWEAKEAERLEWAQRAVEQNEARQDVSGIGHDDPRQIYAGYSKEFLKWVDGRRFRNPATDKQVLFRSLPNEERVKVHAQWKASQKPSPAAKKGLKFAPVPGVSEKRQRQLFDGMLEGVQDALMEPYHGGVYSADGVVLEVDEFGRPTKVQPKSVFSSVDRENAVTSTPDEREIRNVPKDKRAETLRALNKSLLGALRGYSYETEMEVGFRPERGGTEKYAPGDAIHTDGDEFEREVPPDAVMMKLPVKVKVLGVARDKDGDVRVRAELEMVHAQQVEKFRTLTQSMKGTSAKKASKTMKTVEDWSFAKEAQRTEKGKGMWSGKRPTRALVEYYRDELGEQDLGEWEKEFEHILESLIRSEGSPFKGGRPSSRAGEEEARARSDKLYTQAHSWALDILDSLGRKRPKDKIAAIETPDDWSFLVEAAEYLPPFLQFVEGQEFRHPKTKNMVQFVSLPPEEQAKIRVQWQATQAQQPSAYDPEYHEQYKRKWENMPLPPGTPAAPSDDENWKYRDAAGTDWSFVDREAVFVPIPGLAPKPKPRVGPAMGEIEEEPPPPQQVKQELAGRMRDMGRFLMVSAMRSPRQQIVDIGGVLNGLVDQLERLSDQPGRAALKRQILLRLRNRIQGIR